MATDDAQNPQQPDLHALYTSGMDLMGTGSFAAAAVPLRKVVKGDPSNLSAREALGRVAYRIHEYEESVEHFSYVVERQPLNDYAHFGLGRALTQLGEDERAYPHLVMATNLKPSQRDYRIFRDRLAPDDDVDADADAGDGD